MSARGVITLASSTLDPDSQSPLSHRASTVEPPVQRSRPGPLPGTRGYRLDPPPLQPGSIFVPRTTIQQVQDAQREQLTDRLIVQDDRAGRAYERAEVDNLSREERDRLLGRTGFARQWWQGKRTGTGDWH